MIFIQILIVLMLMRIGLAYYPPEFEDYSNEDFYTAFLRGLSIICLLMGGGFAYYSEVWYEQLQGSILVTLSLVAICAPSMAKESPKEEHN